MDEFYCNILWVHLLGAVCGLVVHALSCFCEGTWLYRLMDVSVLGEFIRSLTSLFQRGVQVGSRFQTLFLRVHIIAQSRRNGSGQLPILFLF